MLKCLREVVKNAIYYSLEYKRMRARNSYTVQFSYNGHTQFGKVKYYIQITPTFIVAAIIPFCTSTPADKFHLPCHYCTHCGIFPVRTEYQLIFVDVTNILHKVVYIEFKYAG